MKRLFLALLGMGVLLAPGARAATNAAAKTTGHIASAKLTLTPNKADPVMALAYQCDLTPGAAKIKSPVIAFHFVAARTNGNAGMAVMSGWLRRNAKQADELVQYGQPGEKSRIEPLADAAKLRTLKGRIRYHPSVQFGMYGRLLVYRVELWQDGELLDVFTSKPAAEVKAAGLPDDWYRKVGIIGGAPDAPKAGAGEAGAP